MTAGNTSDVDYSSAYPATGEPIGNETLGVGTGGQGGATSCYGESGNSGAVILYNVPTASATATILGNLAVGTINAGNITAANLISGPVTIRGGLSVDSIQWADGTTSTTSSAGGVLNSTFTYLRNEYTDGVANMGPCISGSTITFTTSGNPVEIFFDFSQAHGASGGGTRVQVLMDGAWVDDFGAAESMAPMSRDPGGSSTVWFPTYLHYRTATAPSSGSHSFCITFERNGGGVSYITCKKAGTAEGPKKCLFMVKELK